MSTFQQKLEGEERSRQSVEGHLPSVQGTMSDLQPSNTTHYACSPGTEEAEAIGSLQFEAFLVVIASSRPARAT